jgi:hypothetical protein
MGFTPIQAGRVAPHIERGYLAGAAYQWVRETAKNAFEAGAKNVTYGVEWQGVVATGTYRRFVLDDGHGMYPDELKTYFRTFGGGGKPIGAAVENYGIGSKTSLFPWNKAGLIVVSRRDGEDSMIRVYYDEKAEEYGLMQEFIEGNGVEDVYAPYFDEDLGVDFAQLLPTKGDGTALLLLGNHLSQDTVTGDPDRDEDHLGGMGRYMDNRFFEPEGRVLIWEMPEKKADWPTERPANLNSKHSPIRTRTTKGLVHFIEQKAVKSGKTLSGTVDLGTAKATWYLREGQAYSGGGYAPKPGIGVRLDNEVFYLTSGSASYARMRAFGITEKAVRERLWIMVDPPAFDPEKYKKDHTHYGVYMKADRATLNWGGAVLMDEMPWTEWADAFARQMPDEIAAVLAAAQPEPDTDEVNKRLYERLKDRIAARLNRTKRYLRDQNGVEQAKLDQPGRGRRVKPPTKAKTPTTPTGATNGSPPPVTALNQGTQPGSEPASEVRPVRHGLPQFAWVGADEFDHEWILIRYDRNAINDDGGKGRIYGNKNHATVREAITHWQDKMVQQDQKTMDGVEAVVMEEFAELAIATVANVEALTSKVTRDDLDTKFRSDEALTTALMGMVGIDAMVGPRLSHVGKTVKVVKAA